MVNQFLVLISSFIMLVSCSAQPGESLDVGDQQTYTVVQDLEWAAPAGHVLTMDIYTPETSQDSYPVLIIFHGGGWLINDKTPMTSMSEYMAEHANYVICNVNYRLLIDAENTITMNQMVEDVMGAVLWIKENISDYQGDPHQVMITGDSAGGHLAAMVLLAGDQLESDGFEGPTLGFNPSYHPSNKPAEQLAQEKALDIQGAILSYAAFDIYGACLYGGLETTNNIFWSFTGTPPRGIFGDSLNVNDNPEYYRAVSPTTLVPDSSQKMLPPVFCTVGSADFVVPPASVEAFVNLMNEQGQSVEYWVHEGRNHAFLDGGANEFLGTEFKRDGIPAIIKMIEFMDRVFYSQSG